MAAFDMKKLMIELVPIDKPQTVKEVKPIGAVTEITTFSTDHFHVPELLNTLVDWLIQEGEKAENFMVTMDFEGMNFGRSKEPISIATIGIEHKLPDTIKIYLDDAKFKKMTEAYTNILVIDMRCEEGLYVPMVKKICEADSIIKIIHNCEMDSDILSVSHDIRIRKVFDTSVVFSFLSGEERRIALNEILHKYGLQVNEARCANSRSFYQENPTFWDTRPITKAMSNRAAGDVYSLTRLSEFLEKAMIDKILRETPVDEKSSKTVLLVAYEHMPRDSLLSIRREQMSKDKKSREDEIGEKSIKPSILQMSEKSIVCLRDNMSVTKKVSVPSKHKGKVIGRRGGNIISICQRHENKIQCHTHTDGFVIFASDQKMADSAAHYINQLWKNYQ
jgi:predicted RNA-binding protein YlqC (UPF0109 family)